MRKKQDIVYEKDLGLDFGFPEIDEPAEEEAEASQDGVPVQEVTVELDETTAPPAFTPDQLLDAPPDWSRYSEDDDPVSLDRPAEDASATNDATTITTPRLEELESKVTQLEDKMDRIVALLERISFIYGKNVSS